MYSEFKEIEKAKEIFDKFGRQDIGCWSCMIHGLGKNKFAKESLNLFETMKKNTNINQTR